MDKSFQDLKGYFDQKGKAEKRAIELEQRIRELKGQRDFYKEQIDALAPGKGQVRVYKKVHEAFDYIYRAFVGAKDKNLTMFLE